MFSLEVQKTFPPKLLELFSYIQRLQYLAVLEQLGLSLLLIAVYLFVLTTGSWWNAALISVFGAAILSLYVYTECHLHSRKKQWREQFEQWRKSEVPSLPCVHLAQFAGSDLQRRQVEGTLAIGVLVLLWWFMPAVGVLLSLLYGLCAIWVLRYQKDAQDVLKQEQESSKEWRSLWRLWKEHPFVFLGNQSAKLMGEALQDRMEKKWNEKEHVGPAILEMIPVGAGALIVLFGASAMLEGYLSGAALLLCALLGGRLFGMMLGLVTSQAEWVLVKKENEACVGKRSEVVQKSPQGLHFEIGQQGLAFCVGWASSGIFSLKSIEGNVGAGRALAVFGPSGSGKSLLLKALKGDLPLEPGCFVQLGGVSVALLSKEQKDSHISVLLGSLQECSVSQEQRSCLNLAWIQEQVQGQKELQGAWERLEQGEVLSLSTCSAGLLRQVQVLLCAKKDLKLLLLDEPESLLDAQGIMLCVRLIEYAKERGSALVLATHSKTLLRSAHGALLLQQGRIIKQGSMHEFTQFT